MNCGACGDPAICRDHGCQQDAMDYAYEQQRRAEYEAEMAMQQSEEYRAMEMAHYRDLYGGCPAHLAVDLTCEDCLVQSREVGLL